MIKCLCGTLIPHEVLKEKSDIRGVCPKCKQGYLVTIIFFKKEQNGGKINV